MKRADNGSRGLRPAEPNGLDAPAHEVLDATPSPIRVSGPDSSCVWANRPWLDFRGRELRQELGLGWTEGVHPDDADSVRTIQAAQSGTRRLFRTQYRLRRHDGQYRWVTEQAAPHYTRDGDFIGFIHLCTDIDEIRTAHDWLGDTAKKLELQVAVSEGALVDSERKFRLLVQSVTDYAIFMLDPHGIVTSWNAGAERIKGYKADEIIGRHFSLFYTEEDRAAGIPQRNLEIAAREGKFEAEGCRVRRDGSDFWAGVVIDPIRNEAGEIVGFAKITRDLTERRNTQKELNKAREQLFQMQKLEAIGQLTGGVAHDFNNLLTIIIGNLEIAQRNLENETAEYAAKLRRVLANAQAGAKRAAALTQRLLAFARRQPLDPKLVDVNKFIANTGEFLARTLGEQIDVEAVGAGALWQVEVDAAQLESAILNLALNARDAMPQGGKLTVEAINTYLDRQYARGNPEVVPGQYVMICVSDTGTGMTPETIAHAFEPFFTTKPAGQGTGLGLAQVYGFVKQSGGHIKVYSERGEGTTFKIYLPRLTGKVTEDETPPAEIVGGQGGETILVVEDDPAVLDYVVEVLRDLNYKILQVTDGRTALNMLQHQSPRVDLILTDVIMPEMSGRALAEQARRLRPGIKILFMTGYSQNAIVHQGRLDPGVHLIQKPLSQSELANRVRDILDAPVRAV